MALAPINYQGQFKPILAVNPGVSQKVSFTATSAQATTAVVSTIVYLLSTQACWVVFGTNPTAAANDGASFFLAANQWRPYAITVGHKIAVIRDATNGDLHITEGQTI